MVEAGARGVLVHVAGAPGGLARAQHEGELRVVVAGELVEFARPRHLVQHVGEIGRGAHGVGKGLRLGDEFRELDFVQRAGAVGQLHAGLEGAVAPPRGGHFPLAGVLVLAFDGERLAAGAARGRQRGQGGVAGDGVLQRQRGDGVHQGVKRRADRAPRVKDVVDDDDRRGLEREGQIGRLEQRRLGDL